MAQKRFPVSMNEDLLRALDEHCELMSISRNGFINFIVAQQLQVQKQMIEQVTNKMVEQLKNAE